MKYKHIQLFGFNQSPPQNRQMEKYALAESAMAPVMLLDTCIFLEFAKIARENKPEHPISEAIDFFKASGKVPVLTKQVLEELETIAAQRRKDDRGNLLLSSEQMCEIRNLAYCGAIRLQGVKIPDSFRRDLLERMIEASPKGNRRLGEGEISLMALASACPDNVEVGIASNDSDFQAFSRKPPEKPG